MKSVACANAPCLSTIVCLLWGISAPVLGEPVTSSCLSQSGFPDAAFIAARHWKIKQIGGDVVPDYKGMYLEMLRASERAIDELVRAQRACEERFLSADETPVDFFSKEPEK